MTAARHMVLVAILAVPRGCTCEAKTPPEEDAPAAAREPTPLERERHRLTILERAFEKAQRDLDAREKRGEPTEEHEKKIEAVWASIVRSREKISTLEKRAREKQ
jgi:hypothetical protein